MKYETPYEKRKREIDESTKLLLSCIAGFTLGFWIVVLVLL